MVKLKGQTTKVRPPGMSEECVKVLLIFMYSRAAHVPRDISVVCLQLRIAGHKYDIYDLQRDMEEILLNMETDLNAEVALELFNFSKRAGLEDQSDASNEGMSKAFE